MNDSIDRALMGGVRDGDLDCLAPLYERHRDRIFDLCARMTGDRTEAADLVQETFVRVLRHRRTFRGTARFSTWLFRIARNVCLDHVKRSREMRACDPVEMDAYRSAKPDPRLGRLKRALDSLAPEARSVIVLSRYHGMTHREIGEVLGCSEGAARVRLHRAVNALRDRFRQLQENAHEL